MNRWTAIRIYDWNSMRTNYNIHMKIAHGILISQKRSSRKTRVGVVSPWSMDIIELKMTWKKKIGREKIDFLTLFDFSLKIQESRLADEKNVVENTFCIQYWHVRCQIISAFHQNLQNWCLIIRASGTDLGKISRFYDKYFLGGYQYYFTL